MAIRRDQNSGDVQAVIYHKRRSQDNTPAGVVKSMNLDLFLVSIRTAVVKVVVSRDLVDILATCFVMQVRIHLVLLHSRNCVFVENNLRRGSVLELLQRQDGAVDNLAVRYSDVENIYTMRLVTLDYVEPAKSRSRLLVIVVKRRRIFYAATRMTTNRVSGLRH